MKIMCDTNIILDVLISKRVTRVYKKDGREDSVFDCILDQP